MNQWKILEGIRKYSRQPHLRAKKIMQRSENLGQNVRSIQFEIDERS